MFGRISGEEKEEAIRYLMANIPEDCLRKVNIMIQNKGQMWRLSLHLNFGMYVRNILREGGFYWDPLALDDLWNTLVEEAAQRVESNKANRN